MQSPPALLPPSPGSSTKAHYHYRQTGNLQTRLESFSPHIFQPSSCSQILLLCKSSLTLMLPFYVPRITVLPNGVLQIHNVQLEDAGQYRCVATNIGSRLKSREATLTVNQGTESALTRCQERAFNHHIIFNFIF